MNEILNKQLNVLSGLVLIAFPTVLLIDDLMTAQASPLKFLLGLAAVWFLGAAIIAVSRRAWDYRPRTVLTADALALFGVFGGCGIMVFRFVMGTIRQADGAIANSTAVNAAIGKITPFIFMPGVLPSLVLFFLSAMLVRFESKSKWAWMTVCVGALLFPAGRIFLGDAVVLTSDALLILGLGYLGLQMVSGKHEQPSQYGAGIVAGSQTA